MKHTLAAMAAPIKLKNWAVEYRHVPELEAKGFTRHAVIRDPKDPDFILVRRNYHEFLLYRVSGKKFNYPAAEFDRIRKPDKPAPCEQPSQKKGISNFWWGVIVGSIVTAAGIIAFALYEIATRN